MARKSTFRNVSRSPSRQSLPRRKSNGKVVTSNAGSTATLLTRPSLNPRTTEYEFFGPYAGPTANTLLLPALVWATAFYCNERGFPEIPRALPTWTQLQGCFSAEAFAVYAGWWLFQALIHLIVPGHTVPGIELRDGRRLSYRINSFRCLLITLAACALLHANGYHLTWICNNFVQLATAAVVFSMGLAMYLYVTSYNDANKLCALNGNSGIFIYDFWMGRELNPLIVSLPRGLGLHHLDLKYFCELRPGLFLWLLIDIAFALRQVAQCAVCLCCTMLNPSLVIGLQAVRAGGCGGCVHAARVRRAGAVYRRLRMVRGVHCHHHRHHLGRFRLHAGVWRPGVGAIHVLHTGAMRDRNLLLKLTQFLHLCRLASSPCILKNCHQLMLRYALLSLSPAFLSFAWQMVKRTHLRKIQMTPQ